jgi:LPXTG-motif cell wall-anchored protein
MLTIKDDGTVTATDKDGNAMEGVEVTGTGPYVVSVTNYQGMLLPYTGATGDHHYPWFGLGFLVAAGAVVATIRHRSQTKSRTV